MYLYKKKDMSWLDLIENNKFTIITGDGKEYSPKWNDAKKRINFHNSKYDFPSVEGSLVHRTEKTGDSYVLKIYFDGEDCIKQGRAFEQSAKDKNVWTLLHPFYGVVLLQPSDIDIDNSSYNVWSATINATTTISKDKIKLSYDETEKLKEIKKKLEDATTITYAESIGDKMPTDKLEQSMSIYDSAISQIIKTQTAFESFKKTVGKAVGKVTKTISDVQSALRLITNIINFPLLIEQDLASRFSSLTDSFNKVSNVFSGKDYEFHASNILVNMSMISIVAPPKSENTNYKLADSYSTRNDVLKQIENINKAYYSYITTIDSFAVAPDFETQRLIDEIITIVIKNLENQIFGLKKEISYILEEDSNIILLVTKFYGTDNLDTDIDKFISINKFSMNEIFSIKKGTKITYYA